MRRTVVSAAGLLLAAIVAACTSGAKATPTATPMAEMTAVADAGDITVFAPSVPAPASNDTAALYFTVKNAGAQDDRIASVATDASGSADIHETVDQGSTSVMEPVEGGLVVPAHGEATLAPGGYHVMLMGLSRTLHAGDGVQVTLTLEHAGTLTFTAPVTSYGGMSMPMPTGTAAAP